VDLFPVNFQQKYSIFTLFGAGGVFNRHFIMIHACLLLQVAAKEQDANNG
jgi:hypothetical protein